MKHICLLSILLTIGLHSKPCSTYAYAMSTPSYNGFGFTASVQVFRYFGWGLGIGYHYLESDRHYLGGSLLKIEYENCSALKTQFIKAGGSVYFYQNFISLLAGMNVLSCFHEQATYYGVRPEIGYGVGFLNITYGRNILGKNTAEFVSKNMFSVNFYIPVKNKSCAADYKI